jgi:hypothetical protein
MLLIIWFLVCVVFIAGYITAATKYDTRLVRSGYRKPGAKHGKVLILVGIGFSLLQVATLPLIFDRNASLGSLFLWLGANGAFCLFAMRIVYGLLKCLLEIKKHNKQG